MSIQMTIFIGYVQSHEVKMHLNQSAKWKEEKTLRELALKETQWQEKDYVGLLIPSAITYDLLKEKEQFIKTQLQIYCPKLNLDKHFIYLFPQLFIS